LSWTKPTPRNGAYERRYLLANFRELSDEESLKTWDYVISDEVVYLSDSFWGLRNSGAIASKLYRDGLAFIDLKFGLTDERNGYYYSFICSLRCQSLGGGNGVREIKEKVAALDRNPPVLIEITHLVEPPQRVTFEGCPTVIWLEFVNDFDSIRGNILELSSESFSTFSDGIFRDRELDVPWNFSAEPRQCPYQLVER
jgi:hypothetical protein